MQNTILSLVIFLTFFPFATFGATGSVGAVDTLSANVVDEHTVEMRASAYGYVAGTQLFFEYGPTQELGRRTYAVGVSVGKAQIGYQRAYYLTPNVTYYYRAVIEGTGGTVYGETRSFVAGYQNDAQYASSNTSVASGGNTQTGTTGTTGVSSGTGSVGGNTGQQGLTGAVGNASAGTDTSESSSAQGVTAVSIIQSPGGFFQRLFDSATRARPVVLSVVMNPEEPKAREVIEYVVTYTNGGNQTVPAGTLSVILPDSVVYLGDNSGGKSALSKVAGGQELIVPTETLSARTSRTWSVMAIAGSAVSVQPATAVASMAYTNAQGVAQQVSTDKAENASPLVASVSGSVGVTSDASGSSGSILPNSFFDWLIFLVVVTGIIVVVRRVMAVYQERKKRILEESREGAPVHA